MKKIRIVLIMIIASLILVGCGSLGESLGLSVSAEEKYEALDSMIKNPASNTQTVIDKLSGKFTFSAYIVSEKDEWDLDGETFDIVVAMISRNVEDVFLINVNNIEDYDLEEGSFVTVTGSLVGSIYWTEENEQVDVLHVEAHKIEPLEVEEVETLESPIFEIKDSYRNANITFKSATSTNILSTYPGAYIYYDFENKSESDTLPFFNGLMFYQGDVLLQTTIMAGDSSIDPEALRSDFSNETPVDKTNYYYTAFEPRYSDETMNTTDPIEVIMYDDDFNMVQIAVLILE